MKLTEKLYHTFVAHLLLICSAFLLSCDVPVLEISEIEFFIAKEWKITTVYQDGVEQSQDNMGSGDFLDRYRLTLNDDFTFSRKFFNEQGDAEGNWQLTSGLTQLVLFAGEPGREEHWLLLDLKVRRLEMRLLQEPNKPQLDIRYVLEPTRGQ